MRSVFYLLDSAAYGSGKALGLLIATAASLGKKAVTGGAPWARGYLVPRA